MKRIFLLTFILLTLSGCGYSSFAKEDARPEVSKEWKQEWSFELTPKNTAYMFNSSIKKLLAYTSTREVFTYMVPQFHTYSQMQEDKDNLYDAYLQIKSIEGETELEQSESLHNITYTYRYLTKEEYVNQGGNWLRNELYDNVDSVDKYDTSKYDSYSDYIAAHKNAIDSMFNQTVTYRDDILLLGEQEEHKAIIYKMQYVLKDAVYDLPVATYYWKLESGNYLSLHISVDNVNYKDLCMSSTYIYEDKDLQKKLNYYSENTVELDLLAKNMVDYVLIGDYSDMFSSTNEQSTIWDRLDDAVVEEYNKDLKVDFIEEEESDVEQPEQSEPTEQSESNRRDQESERGDPVVEQYFETTDEPQQDYDRTVQGYFFD